MWMACRSGRVLTSIILNLELAAFLAMSLRASLAEILIRMLIIMVHLGKNFIEEAALPSKVKRTLRAPALDPKSSVWLNKQHLLKTRNCILKPC